LNSSVDTASVATSLNGNDRGVGGRSGVVLEGDVESGSGLKITLPSVSSPLLRRELLDRSSHGLTTGSEREVVGFLSANPSELSGFTFYYTWGGVDSQLLSESSGCDGKNSGGEDELHYWGC